MHTRRETMTLLAAGVACAAGGADAAPRNVACPIGRPLDAIADALLAHLPETATYNGAPGALDGGPLARTMDD